MPGTCTYRVAVAAILVVIGALMICGSRGLAEPYADRRHQVELSGVVYFRGVPQAGSIRFIPQLLQPEYHPMHVEAQLVLGEFRIPQDIGPEPGLFLIRMGSAADDRTSDVPDRNVVTNDEDGIVRATLRDDIVVRISSQRRQHFKIWLE